MRKIFYDRYTSQSPKEASEAEMPWPKKGQRLLKEPTKKTPREVSAHFDWLQTFDKDLSMPSSYKEGGDFLVEALRLGGDGTHPDRFIFPTLYLYRHAAELRLKEIIRAGLRLKLEEPSDALDKILEDHALYPLWNRVRKILVQVWSDGDTAVLSAFETMIQELHQTDQDGQHLRYPNAKNGEPYKHKIPEQVDLLNLRASFDGLWILMSGSLDTLTDEENCQPY